MSRQESKISTDAPKAHEEVKAAPTGGGFNLNYDLQDTLKTRTESEDEFTGQPEDRVPLEQMIEIEGPAPIDELSGKPETIEEEKEDEALISARMLTSREDVDMEAEG